MMRSLWSGVTGLQAHQIAMDTEGNNIANVNTKGYKYQRANFEDLIYQNSRVPTAPQNEHGGVNGTQVGLGTQVQSTTRIFKQGSLETTDKQTDMALQGDGFFTVSPDGGKTRMYTRNGDFSRDSQGNFVDNHGYKVQGWMRDENTNKIDPTRPIENINIPNGLTEPAKPTSKIGLVANLNSGNNVGTKKIPAYTLDKYHNWVEKNNDGRKSDDERHEENNIGDNQFHVNKNNEQRLRERGVDLGVLHNSNGDAYSLREGQGIWVSYADAKTNPIDVGADVNGRFDKAKTLNLTINGEDIKLSGITTVAQIAQAINAKSSKTGVEASVEGGNKIVLTNRNNTGTDIKTKNIKLKVNNNAGLGDNKNDIKGFVDTNILTAYQYTYSRTRVGATHAYNDEQARQVTTTEDLREAMQQDARKWVNYAHTDVGLMNKGTSNETIDPTNFMLNREANKNDGVEVSVNEQGQIQIKNPKGDAFNEDDGDVTDATTRAEVNNAVKALINAGVTDTSILSAARQSANEDRATAESVSEAAKKVADEAYKKKDATATAAKNAFDKEPDDEAKKTIANDVANALRAIGAGSKSENIIEEARKKAMEAAATADGVKTAVEQAIDQFNAANQNDQIDNNRKTEYAKIAKDTFEQSKKEAKAQAAIEALKKEGITSQNIINATKQAALKDGADANKVEQAVKDAFEAENTKNQNGVKAAKNAPRKASGTAADNLNNADNDHDMYLTVTGLTNPKNNVTENTKFKASIAPINGSLNSGNSTRVSDGTYVSAHSSSTDIYDSLGTKHTVKIDFVKRGYTENGGTEWTMVIQVAEPNVINYNNNGEPSNVVVGYVRFNADGSLATYSPASLTFGSKNGAASGQTIQLNLGQTGTMTGLTSADNESSTKSISQDGYPAGDLNGIRIDETGTIIGTFSNGKSLGLAQVAVSKFANNAGLVAEGGNLFTMSPNSGDPIIGTAATGGRGAITASALEMSNVDLSRSLTQLIVVQRGFQANSKTITTSDEMLNTLLQLKN